MERTLAEKAYDHIRKKLSNGELSAGKRLVNRTLATEIGVSAIPVREALHRLSTEGLVEHVPGSGTFVREVAPQELDHLYVMRDALESCAAGEAARYANELDIEEMEAVLAEAQAIAKKIAGQSSRHATKRQINAWLDLEQRFHAMLIEAARNPLLAKVAREHQAIGQVFDALRKDPLILSAKVATETCTGKSQLLQAIRQRDHNQARKLMSEQIQRGRRQVLRHIRSTASKSAQKSSGMSSC